MSLCINISRLQDFMSSHGAIETAGALAGFAWSYGTPLTLVKNPFTSVFNGGIGAFFGRVCSSLVGEILPVKLRPILFCALLASSIYHVYESCYRRPLVRGRYIPDNSPPCIE